MPSRVQVELTPTNDGDGDGYHTPQLQQHHQQLVEVDDNDAATAVAQDPHNHTNAIPTTGTDPGTDPGTDTDTDEGLLFSCRCESARAVATLLSCLRNVSLPSGAGGGPSLATMQDATSSLLTAPSMTQRRMTQGGGNGGSGGGGGGLRGSKTQYATVFCSERGLTFQVYGVGKQSRATVEMQVGLFSDYYVAEQRVVMDDMDIDEDGGAGGEEIIKGGEFGINLTTVLGCLCVLGTASLDRTTLCLSYDTSSAIFKIELLEDHSTVGGGNGGVIISNCAIPGQSVSDDALLLDDDEFGHETETGLDYAFRAHPIVARARVKSHFLSAAVEELTSCAGAVTATIGVSRVGLELATFGHSTECHVVVPYAGNHPDIFVSLEGVGGQGRGEEGSDGNANMMHARSYPLHSVLSAMRGLEIANETCISMNKNGMVAIQHQVIDKVGNGDPNYVDFIMGCLQDEHEEEYNEPQPEEDAVVAQILTPVENEQEREMRHDLSQFSAQSNGIEFTPSENFRDDPDNDQNDDTPQPRLQRGPPRSGSGSIVDHNKIHSQNSDKHHKHDNDNDSGSETEDENEETQGSSGPPLLFGAVATIGAKSSRERGRFGSRSHNKRRRNLTDHSYSQADSSQGDGDGDGNGGGDNPDDDDDSEFEDTLDVTATTMNISRSRRLLQAGGSSPQLMYGDTHLEASDDEH